MDKAISFELLKTIDKSPAHFMWNYENESYDRTPLELATMVKIFRPYNFDSMFVVSNEKVDEEVVSIVRSGDFAIFTGKMRRGKAWEQFKSENENVEILTQAQVKKAQMFLGMRDKNLIMLSEKDDVLSTLMARVALKNEVIVNLINKEGEFFYSFEWEKLGINLECGIDYVVGDTAYIFHVVKDSNKDSVSRKGNIDNLHQKAAFIKEALIQNGSDINNVGVIVVDEGMPIMATVFHKIADHSMLFGRTYVEYLRTLKGCMDSGDWHGYQDEYSELILRTR